MCISLISLIPSNAKKNDTELFGFGAFTYLSYCIYYNNFIYEKKNTKKCDLSNYQLNSDKDMFLVLSVIKCILSIPSTEKFQRVPIAVPNRTTISFHLLKCLQEQVASQFKQKFI